MADSLRRTPRQHERAAAVGAMNFAAVGENEWLEGAEAIEAMIALRPAELKLAPSAGKAHRTLVKKKKEAKRKPRVCVDLDGVLAKYESWRGPDQIGPPLPGALEFATSLSQIADIVIFTTRCSADHYGEHSTMVSPGRLKIRIIDWLEKYNFPYTDVYVGQGKPHALAFIDDRAVNCSPQKDPEAFSKALAAASALVNPRSAKQLQKKTTVSTNSKEIRTVSKKMTGK